MKKEPLGFYNYTVVLTYIGMLVGFMGITCAFEKNTEAALLCLMISGLFDMFDGAIASTMKRTMDEKCFGIQIDSLSDLICFGVLPAAIVYGLNSNNNQIAYVFCALYVLAALIRLAYFNVDEQNRQRTSDGQREIYFGLPVTSIAVLLPIFFLLQYAFGIKRNLLCNVGMIIVGILFLTPFEIKKPKVVGKIIVVVVGILQFSFLLFGLGDI